MSDDFLGEIRIFSFAFPPRGWAFCNGQLLPINQNQALFAILGTTYGGDGRTTFALPDFRGRMPVHMGTTDGGPARGLGERGGSLTETLSVAEIGHSHTVLGATGPRVGTTPTNATMLASGDMYGNGTPVGQMHPSAIGATGGSQPHSNLQPSLALNICICLQGIFPSPT